MANEKIPEFKGSEQFQPGTQPLPFGSAYRDLAKNSNVLGKLGADIAMNAAVQGAQLAGIKYGKDPKGNIFPAFTKSDQAFTEAYRTTAYATLSTQADELMTGGITALSQGQLTQESIDAFAGNMLQGINDIADLAPDIDKERLKNNFATDLITTQGKLQTKLTYQEKAQLKDNFAVFNNQSNIDIFNYGADGSTKEAEARMYALIKAGEEQKEAGLMSEVQFQSLKKSARINYLTSIVYGKALKADANNDLDTFLHNLKSHMPKGATQTEFIDVGNSLIELLNTSKALDSEFQTALAIEGDGRIDSDKVDEEFINKIREQGSGNTFNRFIVKLFRNRNKKNRRIEERNFAISNWDNGGILGAVGNRPLNDAYLYMADSIFQQSQQDAQAATNATAPLTEWEARILVATQAGKPVPAFIEELERKSFSKNPRDKDEASVAFRHLNENNPGNLVNLNSKAIDVLSAYQVALGAGNSETEAAEVANKRVLEFDKTKQASRNAEWEAHEKDVFGKNLVKGVNKVSGLNLKKTQIDMAVTIKEMYKSTFMSLGGGDTVAKDSFQKKISARYRESMQNGFKEIQYMPLEISVNASPEELRLYRQQIAQQTALQLKAFNDLFDATTRELEKTGGEPEYDFRYEIVSPSEGVKRNPDELKVILDELGPLSKNLKRAEELREQLAVLQRNGEVLPENLNLLIRERGLLLESEKRFFELQEMLKPFQEYNPPKIRRVYRDGTSDNFTLGIYANPLDGLYNGEVLYTVKLIDENNRVQDFLGLHGSLVNNGKRVTYTVDKADLTKQYAKFIAISEAGGRGPFADMLRGLKKLEREARQEVENRKIQRNEKIETTKEALEPVDKEDINEKYSESAEGIVSSAAKEIGIDEKIAGDIVRAESNFNPSAASKTSSAKGLYQFTSATWSTMVERYGEKYGISKGDILNPRANAIMGALLTKENSNGLRRSLGRAPTPTEVYLAHFVGLGRAVKITKAMAEDPSQLSTKFFTKKQIAANKSVIKKTIGETFKELAKRMRSN